MPDTPEIARPQRVALYLPSLRGGGAERVMLGLAKGLWEQGMSVDLVLVRAEGEYLNQLPEGVRLIDLDSHRTAASLPKLLRYLRRERPAVLLSALTPTNLVALIAKLIFGRGLRVVVRQDNTFTEEFDDGSFKERGVLRVLKWLLPSADGIVSVSHGVSDDLRGAVPAVSRKVTTIPNPVVWPDHSEKAAAPVKHPWFDDINIPVVLSVGRLAPVKDHATLLRAFSRVVDSRPARLIILGEGPERRNLTKVAARLGISQYLDMPGFQVNPFAYMSRSKVFVLSSQHEGLPTVLIEAMASGTAVVSTDCRCGPSEILQDGKWGPLVPVGDWRRMARAILETLDNPISPDSLISRASAYSAEASVDRHMEVLSRVTN